MTREPKPHDIPVPPSEMTKLAGYCRMVAGRITLGGNEMFEYGLKHIKRHGYTLEDIHECQAFWWDRWLFDTDSTRDRERSEWCKEAEAILRNRKDSPVPERRDRRG